MKTYILKMIGIVLLSVTITKIANAQTAASAKTQFIKVNGDNIGYRSIGKGTPIVLANRMRGTLDTWDPLFLDKLAENHRVVTFDYPGIGYSTGILPTDMSQVAKFFKDFTQAIKIPKFTVLGWSWGGYLSQTLLLEYPEIVTHAILVGTNPPGKGQFGVQQYWADRALKPINDLADEEILFFEPKSEFSKKAAKSSHDRIYARPGVEGKIPSTMDIFQLFFKGHDDFKTDKLNRREQLTKVNIPVLIISGDDDPSAQVENWYPLIGKIPTAQLMVYPQSGHGPQHQYPELTAKYVDSFIAQHR